jgi:hypothetical protein
VGVALVVGVVLVVVFVLTAGRDEPGMAKEVVAQSLSWPAEIDVRESPVAVVVDEESELAPTWRLFGFRGEPAVALPDDGVLLFIGFFESGSCPLVIERVAEPPDDIDADVMITVGQRGGDVCTADAQPVSFVLVLPDRPVDRISLGHGDYLDVEQGPDDGATDRRVRLTDPAAGLARQCRDAATSLGFAVPCPTKLPLTGGLRVHCGGSCVATTGGDETEARVFVLDVEGYDAPIWASDTVHHLVVEAGKTQEAPLSPCYEGVPAGSLAVNSRDIALLKCPEANISHGEAIHAGHLLGSWDDHEIRYVVSVHGTDNDARALLEDLISSIQLVGP